MLFKNPMTRTVKDIFLEMPLQMQNIFFTSYNQIEIEHLHFFRHGLNVSEETVFHFWLIFP